MKTSDLLFRLSSFNAPSGSEQAALDEVAKLLEPFGKIEKKGIDSIICRSGSIGARYKILLDAHIDQIGMMVTEIKNGFVYVDGVGGVDRRTLLSQQVTIWGSRPVRGVFATVPPHVQKDKDEGYPELNEMAIDTGLSDKAQEVISIGDRVTLRALTQPMLNDRMAGKSLDNRVGIAVLIRTLEIINGSLPRAEVIALISSQEETGERGAMTAAFDTDFSEAIIVDVSFAARPDIKPHKCGKMGGGAMIGISPYVDRRISDRLIKTAQTRSLDYQLEVMGGATGTNLDVIMSAKSGAPCGLVSVPIRNMHTAAEIVDLKDIENAAQLISAYIMQGGLLNV